MKIPVEIQKVQNRHPKLISFHHLAKIKLADQKENNKQCEKSTTLYSHINHFTKTPCLVSHLNIPKFNLNRFYKCWVLISWKFQVKLQLKNGVFPLYLNETCMEMMCFDFDFIYKFPPWYVPLPGSSSHWSCMQFIFTLLSPFKRPAYTSSLI